MTYTLPQRRLASLGALMALVAFTGMLALLGAYGPEEMRLGQTYSSGKARTPDQANSAVATIIWAFVMSVNSNEVRDIFCLCTAKVPKPVQQANADVYNYSAEDERYRYRHAQDERCCALSWDIV
jgi:hypothetical protein